jgi:hypothetical protein
MNKHFNTEGENNKGQNYNWIKQKAKTEVAAVKDKNTQTTNK